MSAVVVLSIISLTLGVETGVGLPVYGYDDQVSNAQTLNIFLTRSLGKFNLELAGGIENFAGKNVDYLLENYSILIGLSRDFGPINIFGRTGPSRIKRTLHTLQEKGTGLAYDIGLGVPIKVEQIVLVPGTAYRGMSDFASGGGSLYLTLKVGYEL